MANNKTEFSRLGKAFASSAIIRSLIRLYNRAKAKNKSGPEDIPSTLYGKLDRAFRESRLLSGTRRIGKTVKRGEAGATDVPLAEKLRRIFLSGRMASPVKRFLTGLLFIRTRRVGIALMSFGIYTAIVWLIKYYTDLVTAPVSELVTGAAAVLVSLLLMSKKTLAAFILHKKLLRFVSVEILGADEKLLRKDTVTEGSAGSSVIFGMLFGILTFFVPPYLLLLAAALIVVISVIFVTPEAGVAVFLLSAIFLDYRFTVFFVSATAIAYLFKLLKKKRTFRIRPIDTAVIAVMLVTLFGSVGKGDGEICSRTVLFISGYFMCRNLLSSRENLFRVTDMLSAAAVAVSSVTLFEFVFGDAVRVFTSSSLFSDMAPGIHPFFATNEDQASFLLLALPFLAIKLPDAPKRQRLVYIIAMIFSAYALAVTAGRGAVVAAFLALLVMYSVYRWDTFVVAVMSLAPAAFLMFLLPEAVLQANISAITDPGRLHASLAALRACMAYPGGTGAGTFRDVYTSFATEAYPQAGDASNAFLQFGLEYGMAAMVLLILTLVLFFMMNRTYLQTSLMTKSKNLVYAPLAAVAGQAVHMLLASGGDDGRIMLITFSVIGIGAAAVSLGQSETEQRYGQGYGFTDFEFMYESESKKEERGL